jgi:CheY-like chemotaxis protein
LSISRKLVELMGGEIAVESTEGVGSVFRFRLPLRYPADALASAPETAEPRLKGQPIVVTEANPRARASLQAWLTHWGGTLSTEAEAQWSLTAMQDGSPAWELRDRQSGTGARRIEKPLRTSQLALTLAEMSGHATARSRPAGEIDQDFAMRVPLRILLAEDNLVNQRVARALLARMGYTIDVVENGAEAVEAVRRGSYDVVLLDVQMPVMDGLEAARRIVAECGVGGPALVGLSANAMASDRREALEAGMTEYLTKPIVVAALQETLLRVAKVPARA